MNAQKRKNICTFMLIIKDFVKLLLDLLIAVILLSICIENGWIMEDSVYEVSYHKFWSLYMVTLVLVPFIMVYRGFTGKYLVEIKVYGDEIALGKAHIDSDLD